MRFLQELKVIMFTTIPTQLENELTVKWKNNPMSKNALSVYSSLNEKIGHVPETLAIKLTPLWKYGSISKITGKITGEDKAPQKVHGHKEEELKYPVYITLWVTSNTK